MFRYLLQWSSLPLTAGADGRRIYRRRIRRSAAIRRLAAAEPLTRRPPRRFPPVLRARRFREGEMERGRELREVLAFFFVPLRLRFAADLRPPRLPFAFCIASCIASVC